jgi:hypothetical protein
VVLDQRLCVLRRNPAEMQPQPFQFLARAYRAFDVVIRAAAGHVQAILSPVNERSLTDAGAQRAERHVRRDPARPERETTGAAELAPHQRADDLLERRLDEIIVVVAARAENAVER